MKPLFPRFGVKRPSNVEGKEIHTVDHNIDTGQKRIYVLFGQPLGELGNLQIGIYIQCVFHHCFKLRTTKIRYTCSKLAIRICRIEFIEVGKMEPADPGANKRHQVYASHAS